MNQKVKKIVGVGVLTALIIVLQMIAAFVKPTGIFSITLSLIPMIIGAALYGWKAGAWLGLVFGVMVLATGDANVFFVINAPGTVITVLAKGIFAGLLSGLVYLGLSKKLNRYFSTVVAGLVCPVVNTGLFLLGCRLFFMETITEWASGLGFPSAGNYMIFGLVGVNFLIEVGVNMILTPAIVQIIRAVRRDA